MIPKPSWLLSLLYLAWAVPLVVAVAWLTPPWQNPDEAGHVIRADQVAHGAIVGKRRNGSAGGLADPGIVSSSEVLAGLPLHYQAKLRPALLDRAAGFRWGRREFIYNPNTAQYPPFLYMPQAIAVLIGEKTRMPIVATLRAARLAACVVATLICAVAFGYARRTAPFLMILAMLPMNVGLFASASQDGLMLACMLLAVGVLDRIVTERRDGTRGETVLIVILLAVVIMARPPYLPLGLLALLVSRTLDRRAWVATGCVLAAGIGWSAIAMAFASVPMNAAAPGAQLRFLLGHPASVAGIVANSWHAHADDLRIELIGRLGWLDTDMAPWFYPLAETLLAIGLAGALGGLSRHCWGVLLAVPAAIAAVVLAEYLTWDGVGAGRVDGLQGRYFEVILAAAALGVPGFRGLARFTGPAAFGATALMASVVPFVMLQAIVGRYYFG